MSKRLERGGRTHELTGPFGGPVINLRVYVSRESYLNSKSTQRRKEISRTVFVVNGRRAQRR